MSPPATGIIVRTRMGRVHFHRRGSGPVVVFLHGCGSLAEEIIAPLPRGLRTEIIAPDRPGYGWSDRLPGGKAGMKSQAAWLHELLDTIGIESCLLVAHSLSAGMALWFAALAPHRTAGLLLVAPFCRPTRESFMPWLRLATPPLVGAALRATVLPLLAERIGRGRMRALLEPYAIPP